MTTPRKRRARSPMREIEDAAFQRALRECPRRADGSMNRRDPEDAVAGALDVEVKARTGLTYDEWVRLPAQPKGRAS